MENSPRLVTTLPLPELSSLPAGSIASVPLLHSTISILFAQHALDPTIAPFPPGDRVIPKSLAYHARLIETTLILLGLCEVSDEGDGTDVEAVLIAAAGQHVRRWEVKRESFPEGLSGYKAWRTHLGRVHATHVESAMREAGYGLPVAPRTGETLDQDRGERTVARCKELLVKKGLPALAGWREAQAAQSGTGSLPERLTDYPAVQLLEDAVCIVFLEHEMEDFAGKMVERITEGTVGPPAHPSSNSGDPGPAPADVTASASSAAARTKLISIVRKTWAKMGPLGRRIAVEEVVQNMPDGRKEVVEEAVRGYSAKSAEGGGGVK
ncbi:hypothetical protein M427DRAFT_71529 [Gonapodya prolifera JEL478]|uniref:Uncharacterized protein n=1 Tax=Gonapodya prolifera (strain JEL478) TaxID=1344416 RepID=A0A139A9H9_GONPJ|nr:hypothetical protein M427DRAFT_71529 [Gonapodya prolifera JEL478]|eukprot:KXS13319.1 hypothetical protein M427DRAFT_71529 [Gonapodya prolifera JEL478]